MDKSKQAKLFDKQASLYERRRKDQSDKQWRQRLLGDAKGNVLELAVGAGANFSFYRTGVNVTAVDISEKMIEKARFAAVSQDIEAHFICGDIEELDFPESLFDTVVSTLSLCSYEDPLMVLRKINHWCKQDGQILLMEHGISSNPIVSSIQKTIDPLFYRYSGCHQTRNIIKLVQQAGLNIEQLESHWINMVHLIWTRPNK
ncbi:class I SAM-dependent methyltransferase [Neobacillus dielmonensis]|uniref:class I SAM-dependent methyltransferase n=1 Tax=Neobacillus dielmonensis TaxID=1347369 RepID=UPI0005A726EC|nr:class I SAM-dependent methyltransferase [Neobacillus dielmonensis]